ncbi:MAG: hypothetical protein INR73_17095 [Williamsia sp.]|nr:hypothetical protein [Williamsia sp.]
MKKGFKIAAFLLLIVSVALYFTVMREGNYQFDAHGFYTGPDGVLHRESAAEKNFFLLLLSIVLLLVTAFLGFKKSRSRIQLK